jgi:serine/threonine-protein kinase
VLVDFSFGDFADQEHLRNEPMPPGVPRYPSPESMRFWALHGYDRRARYAFLETDELFALGAMLYELLTWPWPGDSYPRGSWIAPDGGPASPLEVTLGRVPPSLSDFTMRLIAPSPGERPAHVGELRRVLADLKKREGPMWHTPIPPAPPRVPPVPPFRARVRAALERAAPRLRWRGLWPR